MAWFRNIKDKVHDKVDDIVSDNDELFDNSDRALIRRVFGDASKTSIGWQLAVGGMAGWGSGVIFRRFGLLAALSIGGGLILLQIAQHQRWITINWGRVDRRFNRVKRELGKSNTNWDRVANSMEQFAQENVYLVGAYGVGIIVGLNT